jgi:hypothetical protein
VATVLSSTVTNPSQRNLQLNRKSFADLSASSCNAIIRLFDPSATGKNRAQYSSCSHGVADARRNHARLFGFGLRFGQKIALQHISH